MKHLVLILGFLGVLGSCAGFATTGPPGEADLEGVIVSVSQQGDPMLRVALDPGHRIDEALVRYESTPVRVIRADGSVRPGSRDDLTVGARVRVWTTGVELRSLPPQYFARRIDVVR